MCRIEGCMVPEECKHGVHISVVLMQRRLAGLGLNQQLFDEVTTQMRCRVRVIRGAGTLPVKPMESAWSATALRNAARCCFSLSMRVLSRE